jgi:hypothetical protein
MKSCASSLEELTDLQTTQEILQGRKYGVRRLDSAFLITRATSFKKNGGSFQRLKRRQAAAVQKVLPFRIGF